MYRCFRVPIRIYFCKATTSCTSIKVTVYRRSITIASTAMTHRSIRQTLKEICSHSLTTFAPTRICPGITFQWPMKVSKNQFKEVVATTGFCLTQTCIKLPVDSTSNRPLCKRIVESTTSFVAPNDPSVV